MSPQAPYLWYRYTFTFDDGVKKVFEARLDPETLTIIPPETANAVPPEWTRLENKPCENCPLRSETTPYCPIARNMTTVVDNFAAIISYEETNVLVETPERSSFKRVPVQSALYSLMGIYMSASGCPVMDVLKPMVRFHLPFSSVDETNYRVTSMYVMAQYMRMKEGLTPDWELSGLNQLFEEVHKVNMGFCHRLHDAIEQDSLVNSVSILDVFAHMGKAPSAKKMMSLRKIFAPYLEKKAD